MYKSETAKAQLPKQIQEERLLKQKGKQKHTTSSERLLPEEAVNLTNQRSAKSPQKKKLALNKNQDSKSPLNATNRAMS